MSLTDDWKARKLKAGTYYVRLSDGRVDVAKLSKFNRFYAISYTFEVVEVLAPCDYEELKRVRANNEIAHLRQLLKECKEYLSDVDTYFTKNADEATVLLTKIEEVLK